jgi:pyruvate/2-oxoglutarate dehydrogenase complex dihydrolipoamide dehydrogenase (E3) component
MGEIVETDICVIGAGSGGLSVAAGAVQMGARVVLIEKGRFGGDCLNFGCVPSKSLIAAAHAAHAPRAGAAFGVAPAEPRVDFAAVHDHVQGVIAGIAPHDSPERFEGLGCVVIRAAARFVSPREVEAGGKTVRARRFVIATGSRPGAPPIPGLAETPYLTNESVFELKECPRRLIVIGGGPIGLEMAQSFRRLGAAVTVLELFSIMARDDPEAVAVVRARLLAEGVALREGAKILRAEKRDGGVAVTIEKDGRSDTLEATHLLVAAGRVANVEGLDLEKAGVAYTKKGVSVDAGLVTSNRRVFAIGDAAGSHQFTHMAGYHAGIVIRRALFRLFWTKVDDRGVPWVTFTDPELAQAGLSEAEAKKRHGDVRVLRWPYAENDRARAERATEGFVKAITTPKGRILGATVVGRQAGELIHVWTLAIQNRMKIGQMAGFIAPYPTLGEISKRAAGSFYTPALFGERTRKIVRFLLRLG